jgi:hypothetical protein
VLSVNDGGALLEAKNKSGGHTITIFRDTTTYLEAPGDINRKNSDVTWEQFGQYWYTRLKPIWIANQADYYVITNEQGGGSGDDIRQNYTNLVNYEREIMRLANADGLKVCVLNCAGGSPADLQVWRDICAPFVIEAWAAGNIYGRHVYGDDLVYGDGIPLPGQPSRPLLELQYLNLQGKTGGIVLTECGLDGGYAAPDNRFLDQMIRYNEALEIFGEIVGLCMWNLGEWQDGGTNWQGLTDEFAAYMNANPSDPWAPPDIPPQIGLELHLIDEVAAYHEQPPDPSIVLRRQILHDGYGSTMDEAITTTYNELTYAAMEAYNQADNAHDLRIYYYQMPDYNKIYYFTI